jgi:hypothetical protein
VVGGVPDDGLWRSPNCVHREPRGATVRYFSARQHDDGVRWPGPGGPRVNQGGHGAAAMLADDVNRPRCFLGGADTLNGTPGFVPDDGRGAWVAYPGAWSGGMPGPIAARPDRDYVFPLGRAHNPDFKGVVHVTGKVAVSGVVRGRVTLAATGNIVVADDVTYSSDPAAGSCNDILGIFSGGDIVVADNSLNSPVDRDPDPDDVRWRTFDDTRDEVVHAVLLTLGSFTAESFSLGATAAEPCGNDDTGRGCLYVGGGIIQATRGAVGRTNGTGYLKRYSYDACAAREPPPYFPTTGYFGRGREYEVNPIGFDVKEYFRRISARP